MTHPAQIGSKGGAFRDGRIVLLADPVAARRRQLLRGTGGTTVEAASLNEIFPLAEEIAPDLMVLSADFLREPELEGVVRLAGMIGAGLFLYAAEGSPPIRSPLGARLRCVQMRTGDGLADLLSRNADPRVGSYQGEGETLLPELVLLGASTGGVAAIEAVLMAFPEDCPPTVVVQHMREGFVSGLVQRLNLRCRPRVVEAQQDMPLVRGTIYFAADAERHLTVARQVSARCVLVDAPPRHGHRPAVDPLFESALAWREKVSVALLTGMGTDGAAGMEVLRRAGAHTIAQDRATSTVWGMPGAAVAAGAAEAVLPIDRIGQGLLGGRILSRRPSERHLP